MKWWFSFLAGALALMSCGREKAYHAQLKMLPSFDVPTISADSLHQLLEQKEVLLLDVRSAEEQAVSRLPGAVPLAYEYFSADQLEGVSKDSPIIVYCAVGYRSGEIGEQLKQQGYQRVYNLYGGILEWKNKGYGLVTPSGQPTDKVHTYSGYWSTFLEQGEAVY